MPQYRLKKRIVTKIKTTPRLYGDVADALKIGVPSLINVLRSNHVKLTQKSVLKVLTDYLQIPEDELIDEIGERVPA